ncbi:MAG: FHA domain-containing protein [Clostridia bacterium]|nr:FHA domain-containing protein [Clostridia bacterium]MBP1587896.1 FHA domain-containing protein [Clostridia bacterium]
MERKEEIEGMSASDYSESLKNDGRRAGEIKENGPEARLKISFDRGSVQVKLVSENGFSEYKDFVKRAKKLHGENLEIPPGTVATDGYSMSVRGKETLKELICGREYFDLRKFGALCGSLAGLAEFCLENRETVDVSNVIFDYNCVFVRDPNSAYQFVYMPGSGKAVNRANAAELVKVAFLNTDTSGLTIRQNEDLSQIIKGLHTEKDTGILIDELRHLGMLIADILGNEGLGRRLLRAIGLGERKRKESVKQESAEPAGVLRIKGSGELQELSFEKTIPSGGNLVVRCGRDEDWGDVYISNLFVSRRHLKLTVDRDGMAEIEDLSTNGTRVNGEPLEEGAVFDTGGEGIVVNVTPDCGLEVRFDRGAA